MRARIFLCMVFLVAVSVASCGTPFHRRNATVGENSPGPVESLDRFVQNELAPYLTRQLGSHPRFKNQPFLLVAIRGDDVQAEIDDLTRQIRLDLRDRLLSSPGVNLVWKPAARSWRQHRSLDEIPCDDNRKVSYYVGLDVHLTPVGGKLNVAVRALDLDRGAWVPGFGMTWQGTATEAQRRALGRRHPDEYLRGLRALPFTSSQPDLLASYLAQNLSCLLKQRQTDEAVVQVIRKGAGSDEFFRTTLDLVDNYLNRFREVRVTDDASLANIIIETEIHRVHDNLYQVWVVAKSKEPDQHLPGAETEAYVRLDKPAGLAAQPVAGRAPPRAEPAAIEPLIASFRVVTPVSQALCATDTPWLMGRSLLGEGAHLPNGGCLALELSMRQAAHVFLLAQNGQGLVTGLMPSSCGAYTAHPKLIGAGETFFFPPRSAGAASVLELVGPAGREWIYAVAVKDAALARRLERDMASIPGACSGGERELNRKSSARFWRAHLDSLARQNRGRLEWRAVSFWHDPS